MFFFIHVISKLVNQVFCSGKKKQFINEVRCNRIDKTVDISVAFFTDNVRSLRFEWNKNTYNEGY